MKGGVAVKEKRMKMVRKFSECGKRVLAALLVLSLAWPPVPEAEAAASANIDGFEVWIQWASGSSADVLNWNSAREEEKTVMLQVNYRNNEGGTAAGFPKNTVRIQVPGIGMANRSSVKKADGIVDNSGGEKLWDYSYDAAADIYTFTNRNAIDRETSFAGAFQIAWNFNSREMVHGYEENIQAVLNIGERTSSTNELKFSFTSREDSYQLEAEANALEGPDGLGEDANSYYWVRYGIKETVAERARPAAEKYYTAELPQGAVLKQISQGTVENLGGNRYRFSYAPYQNVYIAYPKSLFGGNLTKQTFQLHGTYLDTDREVLLAEDQAEVKPNDYGFIYNGSLYWVGKGGRILEETEAVRKDDLYEGQVLEYTLMAIARYPAAVSAAVMKNSLLATGSELEEETATPSERGEGNSDREERSILKRATPGELATLPEWDSSNGIYEIPEEDDRLGMQRLLLAEGRAKTMDLYLCDDFIDITGADGTFRQLGDEEYELTDVTIPSFRSFTNANGFPVEKGKYTAEIVLGTDRHQTAAAAFSIDENAHTYRFPAGTNRFFVRIRNVSESLYINQFDIELNVEFHLNPMKPVMESGIIRNNDGLIVEYGGIHHNTVFDDSYLGSDRDRVRQRDMDTYGLLVQRWYYDYPYESDTVYHDVAVSVDEFQGGDRGYTALARFRSDIYRAENLEGWSLYSLLPEGVEVDEEKAGTAKVSVNGFCDEFGSRLNGERLKDGFSLHITENFRNSGRTLVEGRFDYKQDPVSCQNGPGSAVLELPVLISFESLEEHGTSYVIGAEQIISGDRKKSSAYMSGKNGRDDGSAFNDENWRDINGDGNIRQSLVFNSASASVTQVMATQIELQKTVNTPRTYGGYWTNLGEDGKRKNIWAYFGHEYVYRLKVRNIGTPAKHVVIYDHLENGKTSSGETSQWKGTFVRADVSRAQELGLDPMVWYSLKDNPGTLESGDWTKEMPGSGQAVKAVAVEFQAERMITSQEVWVDLHMMAPGEQDELVGKRTVNGFSASFSAGGRMDTLDSNPVSVLLDYPKGTVAIEKTDEISGEKLTGFEFELLTEDGVRAALIRDSGMEPEDIETGTYLLREIKAPAGYEKAPDQKITIQIGLNSVKVKDPRIPGSLRLVKTDASDPERHLEGAVFRLLREDGSTVREGLKTDEKGELAVEDLEWGTYWLEETKAPDGHYLYGNLRKMFTVGASQLTAELEMENRSYGTVVLSKKDQDQPGKGVPGAEYELYTQKGKLLGSYITDQDGEIRVGRLEWGTYYFQEKTPAPGYELNDERIDFTVYRENALSEIHLETKDGEQTASVVLIKYDEEEPERKLSDAVFSLQRETGTETMDLGTYKTDRSGTLTISGLKFGEYVLREIKAPEGYSLAEDGEIEFALDASTAGKVLEFQYGNPRKKGALRLQKVDDEKVPVEGAVFDLYKDGTLFMEGLVTDEFGFIEIGNLQNPVLDWGEYVLKETETPKGYESPEETWKFVIDGEHVQVPVTVTAVNKRNRGSVKLMKYRKGDRDALIPGAVYGLYTTEGICLQRQTTDEKGEAVFDEIPWGAYYLQEISAPEPYVVSEEKLRFSVNQDNCHVQQILEGEDDVRRTSLTITKKIGSGDFYEPFGAPAFLYRIEGTDGAGREHVWYRQIVLGDENYSGSVTLSNIEASDENGYRITELETARYELAGISGTNIREADLESRSVVADLYRKDRAEAVFENHLEEWQKYSHTTSAVNMVKKARTLTYLQVEYTGPEDVTAYFKDGVFRIGDDREFLEKYLDVTAFYDAEDSGGNISRKLSWKEFHIEPDTLEGYGTAAPYTYNLHVSYEEHGVKRSGAFQVEAKADRALYTMIYHDPSGKQTGFQQEPVRYGTTALLRPEAPAGYQFAGWFENSDFTGSSYQPGADFVNTDRREVHLYGKWLPISYSVTYHLGGGTLSGQKTSYTVETESFALPTPVRNGYRFTGWTGSNGGSPQTSVTVEQGSTGNKVYTANWEPVSYSISYNLNGGSISGQKTSYTIETADFLLPTPVRNGYQFTGWTGSNGTVPQIQVAVVKGSTGNRTYTANWKQLYGVLMEGAEFNATVKRLSTGVSSTSGTVNTVIKSIQVTTGAVPAGAKTAVVSDKDSPAEILAYFDQNTGCLYLSCPVSDIRLNSSSYYLFNNMDGLTYIDMRPFDTSGVVNASGMFGSCDNLTGVNLSQMNTQNMTSMNRMFADCKNLSSLDLSSFHTENVTSMYQMFYNDEKLTSVKYGSGFVYRSGCDTGFMFYQCPANKPAWNGTWTSRGQFTPS